MPLLSTKPLIKIGLHPCGNLIHQSLYQLCILGAGGFVLGKIIVDAQ